MFIIYSYLYAIRKHQNKNGKIIFKWTLSRNKEHFVEMIKLITFLKNVQVSFV